MSWKHSSTQHRKSFSKMKKSELIQFANDNGIELDEGMKNADIIEAIKAALQ